jgi:predicted SnoaL-like aldol condensation-catalyzing enzyme
MTGSAKNLLCGDRLESYSKTYSTVRFNAVRKTFKQFKMKKTIFSLLTLMSLIFLMITCNDRDNSTITQKQIDSLTAKIQLVTDAQKQIDANKKMVADFYQELFGDKDVNSIDKYIGDIYIQHNPAVADGKEALKQAAAQWFKGAPQEKIDIQHLSGEGDYVYIHTKSKRGTVTFSIIDIFRLENGKIVEHWDVGQEVPEKSSNPHPMF